MPKSKVKQLNKQKINRIKCHKTKSEMIIVCILTLSLSFSYECLVCVMGICVNLKINLKSMCHTVEIFLKTCFSGFDPVELWSAKNLANNKNAFYWHCNSTRKIFLKQSINLNEDEQTLNIQYIIFVPVDAIFFDKWFYAQFKLCCICCCIVMFTLHKPKSRQNFAIALSLFVYLSVGHDDEIKDFTVVYCTQFNVWHSTELCDYDKQSIMARVLFHPPFIHSYCFVQSNLLWIW